MLTGTPLDLTPFGGMIAALGQLYWLLALAIILFAAWLPKRWWMKLISGGVVAAVVVYPFFVRPVEKHIDARQQAQDQAKARLAESTALFNERCKGAGENIKRTVDNVDGVVWMKWRPETPNFDNQYLRDDPYGRDCGGEECILNLLRVTKLLEKNPDGARKHPGRYNFVESTDPQSGTKFRYAAAMKLVPSWTPEGVAKLKAETGEDPSPTSYRPTLEKVPIDAYTARYGITWDDISTSEDRDHWIAGGSLKVLDLKTNEVIAERIGYMMDRGQGSTAGFRSPWGFAMRSACPAFPSDGTHSTRSWPHTETVLFAKRVLPPSKAE